MREFQAYASKRTAAYAPTPEAAVARFWELNPTARKCNVVEGESDGHFFSIRYGRYSEGDWPMSANDVTRKTDVALLAAAMHGYSGVPYDAAKHGMPTSPTHCAFLMGAHMRESGRTRPRECRMGRGDLVHCNDMVFRFTWQHGAATITRES